MKNLVLIASLAVLMLTGCGGEEGLYSTGVAALDESSACFEVHCSRHGICYQENGWPFCLCDPGFQAVGLECLPGDDVRTTDSPNWCGVGDLIVATAVAEDGRGPNEVGDDLDQYPYDLGRYLDAGEWWCSEFVSWAYRVHDCPFTGGYEDGGWMIGGSTGIRSWFQSNAVWIDSDSAEFDSYEPSPGDYVRWDTSGGGHSSIVRYVSGSTLYTVDGNWSNRVALREISNYKNRSDLDGFGHRGDINYNSRPVVEAGSDQSVYPGTAVLQGTAQDDGEPFGTLTTNWSKVSGPGVVTFSNPAALQTTATFSAAGQYTLRLTADDGELQGTDEVDIEVQQNLAPVVNAGSNQAVCPGTAQLAGTISDDDLPYQYLVSTWTMVSGPGITSFADPAAAQTSVSFSAPGLYTLRLTADDGELNAFDEVDIEVLQNQAPTVDAGADQNVLYPRPVSLAGTVADDGLPGGQLTSTWMLISGPGAPNFDNPSAAVTTVNFPMPGTYTLRLTCDDGELTAFDDLTIDLYPNQPPRVDAGPDSVVILPNPANLAATVGDDGLPDGTLQSTWSLVDGPGQVTFLDPASPATTAHFTAVGRYVLRLSVSDGELSVEDDLNIEVRQNQAPTVEAGPDRKVFLPNHLTLQGQLLDDGHPNPELSVSWSMLSGPAPVGFQDPNAPATIANFPATGVYVLELTASDGEYQVSDQVTITAEVVITGGCACQSQSGAASASWLLILLMVYGILRSSKSEVIHGYQKKEN